MFRYLLFLCSALTATADKSASKERWLLIMVAVVTILVVAVVAFLGFRYIIGLKKQNENIEDLVKQFWKSDSQNKEQMIRAQIKKISWLPSHNYINFCDSLEFFFGLFVLKNSQFAEDEERDSFVSQFNDLSKYQKDPPFPSKVLRLYILYSNGSLSLTTKEKACSGDFITNSVFRFEYEKEIIDNNQEKVTESFECLLIILSTKLVGQ